MARSQEQLDKVEASFNVSTINQKKAFIFGVAWLFKEKFSIRLFQKEYKLAKDNIGKRSMVFGVERWPKVNYKKVRLTTPMRQYYQLLEQSLQNEEWRVDSTSRSLLLHHNSYQHLNVELELCERVWWDIMTEVKTTVYARDSQRLALQVFENEDFGLPFNVLCDSLEDSGHDAELAHLQSGTHTPACPVIRAIAGIR